MPTQDTGKPIVIVGGGLAGGNAALTLREEGFAGRVVLVGREVAASLTQLGVRVTAIFPGSAPLERVLGGELGAAIGAIHRENGVELRCEDQVAAFEGAERVEAAVTAAGERVACDFVVVGVGIEPELPSFSGSSVAESNGLLVDEHCRATVADIYAAGDVASHLHPVV